MSEIEEYTLKWINKEIENDEFLKKLEENEDTTKTIEHVKRRLCLERGYIFPDDKIKEDMDTLLSEIFEKLEKDNTLKEEFEKELDSPDSIINDYFKKEYLPTIKEDTMLWKENKKEFIDQLKVYRKNGLTDPNLGSILLDFARRINNDPLRYIYEIIQNADDCEYEDGETPAISIDFLEDNKIQVTYNEKGMTYRDVIAITTIGESNKQDRKKKRLIGEKGIGFKTIFSVCENVDIHSGGYDFQMNWKKIYPTHAKPISSDSSQKTTLILHLLCKESVSSSNVENKEKEVSKRIIDIDNVYKILKTKYGFDDNRIDYQKAFQNCPVLFTNKLTKIKLKGKKEVSKRIIDIGKVYKTLKTKYGFDDNKIDYQKAFQNCPVLFTNKLTKIKLKGKIEGKEESITIEKIKGSEENKIILNYIVNENEVGYIECYHQSYDVEFNFEEYSSRYGDQFKDKDEFENEKNKEVITYPIEIIAPTEKNLEQITEGSIYSYLPTSVTINAPISIQIPAKLSLDRSCIHFVGDQDTANTGKNSNGQSNMIKWNERLFDELFFKDKPFIQQFYEFLRGTVNNNQTMIKYIPIFNEGNLFDTLVQDDKNPHSYLNTYCKNKDILEKFKAIEYLKVSSSYDEKSEKEYCKLSEAVMLDQWMEKNTKFRNAYFDKLCELLQENENTEKCLIDWLELGRNDNKNDDNLKMLGFISDYIEKCKGTKEKRKISIINSILQHNQYENYIKCIQEHIQEVIGENEQVEKKVLKSNYFPESIEELTIFPVKREEETEFLALVNKEGEVDHGQQKQNYWFVDRDAESENRDQHFSAEQICIWDNEYGDFLKKLNKIVGNNSNKNWNIGELSAENIWEDIVGKKEDINKNLLEEIMILLDKLGVLDEQENTNKEQVEIQSNGNNNNDNNQQIWQNKLKEILLTKNKGTFWSEGKKTCISTIIMELLKKGRE